MPEARLVDIAITVEASPATTAFNIRFSDDAGETWTHYDPASATPVAAADILVATLSAGVCTINGINTPTGNAAAASAEGNWYAYRLKSASGYGNWSVPFKAAAEPETDGPLADIADVIEDFSVIADGEPNTGALSGWAYANNPARDRALGRLLTDAMDEMRARSGIDALYTGASTTNGQRRALARAERYWAVADALVRPATMKALGIHEPLLMEDGTDIREHSDWLRSRATEIIDTLLGDATPGATPAFAMPAVSSSTFTPLAGDRGPLDRMLLQDERDLVSAWDTTNG